MYPPCLLGGIGELTDHVQLGVSALATTRSAWLIMGEQIRVIGAVTPARRIVSIFSMRESPSAHTPACSNAVAISRFPRVAFGNAGDGDTPSPQAIDQGGRIMLNFFEVDLQPWSGHSVAATNLFLRSRNAERTMSASWADGRLSASVTGMQSSSLYRAIAGPISPSVMFS